jgi:hypothetical protein
MSLHIVSSLVRLPPLVQKALPQRDLSAITYPNRLREISKILFKETDQTRIPSLNKFLTNGFFGSFPELKKILLGKDIKARNKFSLALLTELHNAPNTMLHVNDEKVFRQLIHPHSQVLRLFEKIAAKDFKGAREIYGTLKRPSKVLETFFPQEFPAVAVMPPRPKMATAEYRLNQG